ncbi:MAG: HNH/ENDO VII family nuclease, partial [Eubacterium sp.]
NMNILKLDESITKEISKPEERGLTDKEKEKLKDKTGWSNEIIGEINSTKEAEIYQKANLQEVEIDGRKCLVKKDVNMEQKDEFGKTNKERMKNGQPALTKNYETIELHHIGQKSDSFLAELTKEEHRGVGNDTILHDKQKESEIDRNAFKKEREHHWESRADQEIDGGKN